MLCEFAACRSPFGRRRDEFVTVLDEGHLAIPDATGNNRLDTLANVIANAASGSCS